MPRSSATTVSAYIAELPPERRKVVKTVRDALKKRLPKGFVEEMGYGVICYNVPKSVLAETYNGLPLMYAGMAAQKNYCVIYLMTASAGTPAGKRMAAEFAAAGKKLKMGGSCVRFTSLEDISLEALGNALAATSVDDYVALYHKSRLQTVAGRKKAGGTVVAKKTTAPRKAAVQKKTAGSKKK